VKITLVMSALLYYNSMVVLATEATVHCCDYCTADVVVLDISATAASDVLDILATPIPVVIDT
jgi:hypothetical protein